jgi:hypothetical protein
VTELVSDLVGEQVVAQVGGMDAVVDEKTAGLIIGELKVGELKVPGTNGTRISVKRGVEE